MVEKISELQLGELLGYCAIVVAVLSTFLEVSKIKINPWSALGRALGNVINKNVIEKLDKMEQAQTETRQKLDDHIRIDDERNADLHRMRILEFNTGLMRGLRHTEEDFNEILYNIKCYETYCTDHPEYENNRAVHAIKNIERVYDECMINHDFL